MLTWTVRRGTMRDPQIREQCAAVLMGRMSATDLNYRSHDPTRLHSLILGQARQLQDAPPL